MTSRLRSITRLHAGEYELVFDEGGLTRPMVCAVVDVDGIRVVKPHPDLMTSVGVSPRLIAAAVLAFDATVRNDGV